MAAQDDRVPACASLGPRTVPAYASVVAGRSATSTADAAQVPLASPFDTTTTSGGSGHEELASSGPNLRTPW